MQKNKIKDTQEVSYNCTGLSYISKIKSLIKKNCKACRGSGFPEVHETDVYKDALVNINNKIARMMTCKVLPGKMI